MKSTHYGMPTYAVISSNKDFDGERLLGPDTNETLRLPDRARKHKLLLCEAIVNSLLGHGRL